MDLKKIWDWISRNIVTIVFLLGSLYFIGFQKELLNTIAICVAIEFTAIILSGVALFVFTRIKFVEISDTTAAIGIFVGVHFLVAVVVLGVYISQFSSSIPLPH